YSGPETFDVSGQYLIPGFIDGHCHVESSKLNVDEFARAILPTGTTAVVVDPHELANVLGLEGIEYMLAASKGLPLRVYIMLPSCVPASPFESPHRTLEASDLTELLGRQRVLGIAEMMNYPAAIAGEAEAMSKMAAAGYRHIDGHAPGVTGRALNAYLVAGPCSDHECTTMAEALEKRRLGMWIMIREASMIRNLVDLLPLVSEYGTENCMFVTDDREASTLLSEGHINSMVRTAVEHGLPAADAVKLATLNVARYHGLNNLGAVAPGYAADISVVPNLRDFKPTAVFRSGRLVALNGRSVPFESSRPPRSVLETVHIRAISAEDFGLAADGEREIRVVDLVPDQVLTRDGRAPAPVHDRHFVADPSRDLVKLAVVERHHALGRIGKGFVRGFGLRDGAFGSTIAHDAHNVVVAGVDDADMALCVSRLAELGGGLVVARHGEVVGELPLPIAGLMSDAPAAEVAAGLAGLEAMLREMGVLIDTPFMYLGFLALSVIPELRLTDQGLIDVRNFERVPLAIS
ncbi:MAG: adenine deaminase, partial [Chloroflexota bacterium]